MEENTSGKIPKINEIEVYIEKVEFEIESLERQQTSIVERKVRERKCKSMAIEKLTALNDESEDTHEFQKMSEAKLIAIEFTKAQVKLESNNIKLTPFYN